MRLLKETELELVESGSNLQKNYCAAVAVGGAGYIILSVGLGFAGVAALTAFYLASEITCKSFGY